MTFYIIGPMTGYPDFNRPKFDAKATKLRAEGHRVINPADIKELPYEEYWKINKAMLDASDAIYVLNGWHKSEGANKEYNYAVKKKLDILYEFDDVED